MSIADKLSKLQVDIANAYKSIEEKSGTIPTNKNTENLAGAIDTIIGGGGTTAYVVFFDSEGGTEVPAQQITANGTASEPTAPTKAGYQFLYWALNDVEYDFSTPITDNILLVAVWEEKEYTQVEYLESTGTQYINTSVKPSSTIYIEHVASFKNDNTTVLSGSEHTTMSYGRFKWGSNTSNTLYIGYRENNRGGTVSSGFGLDDYFTFKIGKGIQEIVGVFSYTDGNALQYYSSAPITLMALTSQSGSKKECMGNQRTKSCKIYDNNVLIRDYVPVIRNSDNVAGLLDKANNIFYPNAGTGTFLTGDVVGYI